MGLYTIKPDGTELTQIFGNRVVREIPDTSLLYWEDPTYSPDGRWIAFVNNSTSHEDPDRRSQLFVLDAHGMNLRRVTSEPREKILASWSPDGEHPLYENVLYEQRGLFVVNASGTGRQEITTTQYGEQVQERSLANAVWLP